MSTGSFIQECGGLQLFIVPEVIEGGEAHEVADVTQAGGSNFRRLDDEDKGSQKLNCVGHIKKSVETLRRL